MTSLAERRRKIRKRLKQKRLEQQSQFKRLPYIPKRATEYGCPKCRIIIYPFDWFLQGTWIHLSHQPKTCRRCGCKLVKIKNEM